MNATIGRRSHGGLRWSEFLKLAGVLPLAGLLIFLLTLQVERKPAAIHVTVASGKAHLGGLAPDFTSQTLAGTTVRLSQYRGKPVILNFWATWCGPCQDEMPLIQREADYRAQGLTVLAVNFQETDTDAMRRFLRQADARFAAVYDPVGQIAGAYGVTIGLPVSVFIDRSGVVRFIQLGQISSSVLEQQLHSIL